MDKFAKKCSRCCEEIAGKFFRAMDRDWHEECLSCFQCKTVSVRYEDGDDDA